MKHHRVRSILVTIAALLVAQASLYGAPDPYVDIPTAFVVDPCRTYGAVPEDWASELRMIDMSDSPPLEIDFDYEGLQFGGVAFASVPGYEKQYLFATLGSTLFVYDIKHRWLPEPEDPDIEENTSSLVLTHVVDIGAALNLPGLELGRISAGNWVPIEVQPDVLVPQAALYIAGTRPDDNEAFYIVVDQESLISESPVQIYGHDQICLGNGCSVSAVLDIRVGDLPGPSYVEEAYVTVVQAFGSSELQFTYRIERLIDGSNFTLTYVHGSYFEAPASGYDPPLVKEASGLRFAPGSHDAYVPRKHERTIENLASGAASCELPAEPTDVAVWQPATSGLRYLLATTYDGSIGRLYLTAADGCVNPQKPVALDVPLGNRPASVDLYTTDDDEALVLVVGEGEREFQAIHLTYDGQTDSFTYEIEDLGLKTGAIQTSCPSFVQFGLRDLIDLDGTPPPPWEPKMDPFKGKDRNCLPGDLRCNIKPRPPLS